MCVRPARDSTGACWRASNCCGHSFFHPLDMLEMHLLAQMSPAATSWRNKRLLLKILNFAWSDLRAVKIAVVVLKGLIFCGATLYKSFLLFIYAPKWSQGLSSVLDY